MNKKLIVLLVLTLTLGLVSACNTSDPTATTVPPTAIPAEPTNPPDPTEPSGEPVQSELDQETPAAAELQPLFDLDWQDREIFRAGLIQAEQGVLENLAGATVYHQELIISDNLLTLAGRQQVHYTNREEVPLEEIYFQTFPNIAGGRTAILTVQVDGQDVTPESVFEDSAVRLPLPAALQSGQTTLIDMLFEVQVAQEMAGNHGLFGYFDEILVLDEYYPVIPVYDEEGWNVKVPPPAGDLTHFDASFYLVQVTAPTELVTIASGREIEREEKGEQKVVTYAAGPVRDFYLAASQHFTVNSQQLGETTVNAYAFADKDEMNSLALETAVNALQVFGGRFGPYPYTEFDVVSTPMQALGIEYPGIVGITLNLYEPDAIVSGLPSQNLMVTVVAHEVGHQWFYSVVGNDQVDEPWLDESITQFCTNLFYEDFYGPPAANNYRGTWDYLWGQAERAELPIGLPSGDYPDGFYTGIVYGRGAYFMMALRAEMGSDTFYAFMRDYYQTQKWDIGTGEIFRQLAKKHCNCDLTELWNEWVYDPSQSQSSVQQLYLGQTPPGKTPELFAPGIVSTNRREGSLVVNPEGDEIYFWVYLDAEQITEIFEVRFIDQLWSEPQILPFSGQYIEGFLGVHLAEPRLYFQSNRPVDGSISEYEWNIWYVDKINDTWGEPQPMEAPINGQSDVSGPSVTLDGTMYFTVMKDDRNDLYRSAYVNGEYQEPEKLPDNVNSVKQQFDSYIAPDESYLLFGAYQRSDSYGGTDLYVSFRDQAGNWGDPINLGPTINTSGDEGLATVSPDGKYIFFTRLNGNNDLDVFWISSQFLDDLI